MSEEIQQNNQEYGADQIQILEVLEAVRKRPGMYIGSTSSRGLHHLVYEIVDNAVDEALAGYCKNIEITIEEDNSITVVDDGRGIPVGTNHKAGKSALEVVFTVLHAGGKFGGGGYKVSGGLHGVGASVVNALSTWLTVEVYKDGKIYGQSYKRGKADDAVKVIGECDENLHGTKVHFLPDAEIFEETVYDYDTLKQRLRETAFLTKGLKITIKDVRENSHHNHDNCLFRLGSNHHNTTLQIHDKTYFLHNGIHHSFHNGEYHHSLPNSTLSSGRHLLIEMDIHTLPSTYQDPHNSSKSHYINSRCI